ncbi:MAG: hypothetical protein KDC87_18070 [Planctomycetes bacterium]|nr:hypothetical protein [Planctomycetota bacterium]MCB9868904.1 hypothetical protein [Planctomycetota bacterium]
MSAPSPAARDAVARVFAALDYPALGAIYCDEGGEEFWEAHRGPAEQLGLQWAGALSSRLPPGGRSLYVGAGVAELPAMVVEACDLGREVVATNLDASECAVLDAALAASGLPTALRVHPVDAGETAAGAPCAFDHLSLVSVLTDPVHYPVVSAVAYGRMPPVQLDLDAFRDERAILVLLVERLLGALRAPAVVTTTFEEVSWLLSGADSVGLAIEADDELVPTALVGDELGFLRVTGR